MPKKLPITTSRRDAGQLIRAKLKPVLSQMTTQQQISCACGKRTAATIYAAQDILGRQAELQIGVDVYAVAPETRGTHERRIQEPTGHHRGAVSYTSALFGKMRSEQYRSLLLGHPVSSCWAATRTTIATSIKQQWIAIKTL